MGLAIKLAGWKLHIEPRLELHHYMPEARLSWGYLLKFFLVDMEGDHTAADLELRIGRPIGLLRLRSRYMALRHEIARELWRRRQSPLWDVD